MHGDLHDVSSVADACRDVSKVVAAAHAFDGKAAGVQMDSVDQTRDMADTLKRFPMALTRLEDVVRARYTHPSTI